jgi:hypothetical protein
MKTANDCSRNLIVAIVTLALACGVGTVHADFTISTPTQLGPPIWYPGDDPQGCCFSRDGLELYFSSNRPGGYGTYDIWVATRETVDAPWMEPVNLGPNVNSSHGEVDPAISPDGLEIYFGWYWESNPKFVRRCTRPSKGAPWSRPEIVFPSAVWSGHGTTNAEVPADGLSLYVTGGWPRNIFVSNRATTEDDWGPPVNLGPSVNTTSGDAYASISSDGLAPFFNSWRPGGGNDGWDIWVTTRPTTDAEWGPPVYYPSFNQDLQIWDPAISPDGSVLYFESIFTRWQSSITPIVDFNGDGKVDERDMALLVADWGKNNSVCDIGPYPWGDGIVDTYDLSVLLKEMTGSGIALHPRSDASEVTCDAILSWTSVSFAQSYDV